MNCIKKWTKIICILAIAGIAGCAADGEDAVEASSQAPLTSADGRYIVDTPNPAARAAVARAGQIALDLPHGAVAAYLTEQAVAGLANNPNVGDIEPDVKRYLSSNQGMAETIPYGIGLVQADQVPAGSDAVKVCIIDSGFSNTHEDLSGLSVTASPDSGTGDPYYDDNGHGTHVAGTIAAIDNTVGVVGVVSNPSAISLHIVKVFTKDGWAYSSTLQNAAYACADNGAKVINMSLGGAFKSRSEERAFADLASQGVLSIAAAGNDGNTRRSYPASYDDVVSVAALDQNKQIADFSQQNNAVEIAAPGVGVLSTTPWDSTTAVVTPTGTLDAGGMEGSADGTATGELVSAGLCDNVVAGSLSGKIALCERGSISFYDKVNNAAGIGGAAGVIVYNNVEGGFAGTCGGPCDPPGVIAVTLSQAQGQSLEAELLSGPFDVTVESQYFFPQSGYEAWNGTSMATPHVVGVAALLWSNFPGATAADVRNAINTTAEDLGEAGLDNAYGHGLVRAKAAFDLLATQFGPPCTDADGDGVCAEVDCDDTDPTIGGDGDGDGVCAGLDCDDTDPTVSVDADGDGLCANVDCDDTDPTNVLFDADRDGVCSDLDCDDSDPAYTTDCPCTDADGDGVCVADDCDDTDPFVGTECPACFMVGDSCTEDADCCSNSCSRGKPDTRVCLSN